MNIAESMSATQIRVLIVEDSASDAGLMVRQLQKSGFDVSHQRVESAEGMRAAMAQQAWDLVLSDFDVPGFGATQALSLLHETGPDIPFIVVSGLIDEATAVELMRRGAHDYLMKSSLARLGPAVTRELAEARERAGNREKDKALRESERRYRSLFDRATDGILILDMQGNIVDANDAFARMHGYASGELIHKHLRDLDTPEVEALAPKRLQRLARGDSLRFEVEHYHRDRHLVPFDVAASALDLDGKRYVLAFHRDITERKRTEAEIKHYIARLERSTEATLRAVALIVEKRDPYTAGHERRVGELVAAIGREMALPADTIEGLRLAGYVHDVGKVSVPAEILAKPSRLSPLEFELIKAHPQSGYDILKDVDFPWPLAEIVLQHHERMDGSGYPRQLKGEEIIREARIMAVADVVEAMSSHRPYRAGLGIEPALAEIEKNSVRLYDAEAANACLRLFREKGYVLPG